jgi:Glycosyltransferase family 87
MLRRLDPAAPPVAGRRRATIELVLRAVLVVLAIVVLPRIFTNDVRHFRHVAQYLFHGHLPYRDQLWEFPPLTLVTLVLEPLSFGSLSAFMVLFAVGMVACEYGSLVLLRRTFIEHDRAITTVWNAAVLPVALLTWFRNDFLAVLFATLAIVAIERRRSPTFPLALGAAAKLWPALFIVVAAVERRWRQVVVAASATIGGVLLWWVYSPEGVRAFLRFRRGTGLQLESLPASIRLLGHPARAVVRSGALVIDPGRFGWVEKGSYVVLAVFAAYAMWRAWRPGRDTVALGGALVLASMLFSRILSPQYLVWVAPFVAVAWARGNRRAGVLYAAAAWLTIPILIWYLPLQHANVAVTLVLLARNGLLLWLLAELTVAIRPAPAIAESVVDERPRAAVA